MPEDCVWTAGQGAAEDGCLIMLHKMNLELLRQCALKQPAHIRRLIVNAESPLIQVSRFAEMLRPYNPYVGFSLLSTGFKTMAPSMRYT